MAHEFGRRIVDFNRVRKRVGRRLPADRVNLPIGTGHCSQSLSRDIHRCNVGPLVGRRMQRLDAREDIVIVVVSTDRVDRAVVAGDCDVTRPGR